MLDHAAGLHTPTRCAVLCVARAVLRFAGLIKALTAAVKAVTAALQALQSQGGALSEQSHMPLLRLASTLLLFATAAPAGAGYASADACEPSAAVLLAALPAFLLAVLQLGAPTELAARITDNSTAGVRAMMSQRGDLGCLRGTPPVALQRCPCSRRVYS
jgi:hypothetical protein